MLRKRDCCLCSQIQGRKENDLIARLLPDEPYARRIMMESASFAVIPSLGPLAPGHSLLCPKHHARSFADIEDTLHAEYHHVREELAAELRRKHGTGIVAFEHGMASAGDRILCSVDHAHMHFLPVPSAFGSDVPPEGEWIEFDGSLRALKRLSSGCEYIFYESPDGVCRLLISSGGSFESQYMRRILSEELGQASLWNWRDTPDARAADETWRSFARP